MHSKKISFHPSINTEHTFINHLTTEAKIALEITAFNLYQTKHNQILTNYFKQGLALDNKLLEFNPRLKERDLIKNHQKLLSHNIDGFKNHCTIPSPKGYVDLERINIQIEGCETVGKQHQDIKEAISKQISNKLLALFVSHLGGQFFCNLFFEFIHNNIRPSIETNSKTQVGRFSQPNNKALWRKINENTLHFHIYQSYSIATYEAENGMSFAAAKDKYSQSFKAISDLEHKLLSRQTIPNHQQNETDKLIAANWEPAVILETVLAFQAVDDQILLCIHGCDLYINCHDLLIHPTLSASVETSLADFVKSVNFNTHCLDLSTNTIDNNLFRSQMENWPIQFQEIKENPPLSWWQSWWTSNSTTGATQTFKSPIEIPDRLVPTSKMI